MSLHDFDLLKTLNFRILSVFKVIFPHMTAKVAFSFGSLDLDKETQVCSFYQIEINMSPR